MPVYEVTIKIRMNRPDQLSARHAAISIARAINRQQVAAIKGDATVGKIEETTPNPVDFGRPTSG